MRYMTYNGFKIKTNQNQPAFKIESIEYNIKWKNYNHDIALAVLKYVFLLGTIASIFQFFKSVREFAVL